MSFNMAAELRRQLQNVSPAAPRTIDTVTREIIDLKRKAGESAVGIGQRLMEAKELLPHGEWLPWLEQQVDFSERTAQKFMAIARGYEENPQLAADLGSEKAFALLALPSEERQQIVTEGVTVEGKTKAAADLTTREVKQIVAERKAEPVKVQPERQSVDVYLAEREEEDWKFRELLQRYSDRFLRCLLVGGSRQDGIMSLKEQLKRSANHSSVGGWYGSPKDLTLYGADKKPIKRTWTEVWDHLAVLTLQEAARPKPEPEGQLMMNGWMPGGTNPGHPCTCAAVIRLPSGNAKRTFYRWNGTRWEFDDIDEEVAILPVKWVELPEEDL